jgi:putative DNA primase/helicase
MLAVIFEGNYTSIDEAFRHSNYYKSKDIVHREKWEVRNDYREETIKKAITSYHQYRIERATEFELNDTGNARRFVQSYKDVVRYNVDNINWMVWNGKYWQTDMFASVKIMAEAVIEQMRIDMNNASSEEARKAMMNNIKRTMNSSNKQAMIREAQHIDGIPVTNASFDTQPYLFNCKSGVVDIRTGEISPHDKTLLLSRYTDIEVSYEKPQLWLKFLSEIFEGNKQLIDYVQRVFGYALTGFMREQSMFILHGDGSNGKSLLLEVIAKIIGGYGTTSSVNILVERKLQGANMSEIARLNKIRYVVTDETEIGDKLRESAIKTMTSDYGDIVARFLYGNEFTFKPQFKIFMATNHKPIIRGTDHGIWRRIKLIPFNVVIPDEKQDRSLGEKLCYEYPQILGWLLQGAKLWYESGLSIPDAMTEAISDYRSEMDLVQKWINDNCDVDANLITSSTELFKNITQYCIENKEFQMSSTLFGRNMGKKFEKRRIGGVQSYIGIGIRRDKLDVAIDKAGYAEGLTYRDV